ncbi:probable cytosolic oligopeptidase A [Ixodes scapularis]|uniref:probable cytosolic oligopeptidase A n=1 Tax=Ixodes scapularis TaxID=6945 RepID=UPI001A9D4FDF|nr:probable cytosolic oligopeptidase A [Ixodes scapularis]
MAAFTWPLRGRALFAVTRRLPPFCSQKRNKYIVLLPEVPEDTAETNPLLRYTLLPEYTDLTGEKCYNAIGKLIVEFESGVCKLEEDVQDGSYVKTFESVMDPLERLAAPLESAWSALRNLYLVNKRDDIAEAYMQLHSRVHRAKAKRFQSLPIYHAVKELQTDSHLYSEEQRRIIRKHCLEARLMGVDLTGSASKLLSQAVERTAREAGFYRQKLQQAMDVFRHRVDGDMVRNFPEDLVRRLAVDKTNPSRGPWVVTLQEDVYEGFLQYCGDRLHRWNVWNAYNTRASFANKELNNSLHIEEIRCQRQAQAEILGYKNFVELSMETKMAGSLENVQATIEALRERVKPAAEEEVRSLHEFTAERGFRDKLELWDVPYWRRKQRQAVFRYDEAEVREYFPLPTVLDGLYRLCNRLFGITVKESSLSAKAWHPDVKAYDILDASGNHAGSFFLDPYARTNKHAGSWMEAARGRSVTLGTLPVANLVFSFQPPLLGRPSLLSYADVCTLFRKFGHTLQHCLTRTRYAEVSGLSGVEWDLVEACPNVCEMLLSQHPVAAAVSGHVDDGRPLSAELHAKLHGAKTHMVALDLCWELYYSCLDLELYSKKEFWQDVCSRLWPQFIPLPRDKRECHLCSFTPITVGDFPAAYFSFLWSKMVAADIFGAFRQVGFAEGSEVDHVGERFRETFLELGGSCEGSEVFRRFMGRDPSPESLLAAYGLQSKQPLEP